MVVKTPPKRVSSATGKKKCVTVLKSDAYADAYDTLWYICEMFNIIQTDTSPKGKRVKDALRKSAIKTWTESSVNVPWYKYMKWKLAAFFAAHTAQDEPDCPEGAIRGKPEVLIGGFPGQNIRLFLKKNGLGFARNGRLHSDKQGRRFQEFMNSVLNSKKGMLRVGDDVVEKELEKTVLALTTIHPQDEGGYLMDWADASDDNKVSIMLDNLSMEEELRRTVREVFGGKEYTDDDRQRMMFPSTSSNYNNTRSEAGTVGALLEESSVLEKFRRPGGYLKYGSKLTRTYDVAPDDVEGDFIKTTVRVDEDYDQGLGGDEIALDSMYGNTQEECIEDEDTTLMVVDDTELRAVYQEFLEDALKAAETEKPSVKAVGLKEPLKVRVISKGPPITYFVMRNLWKKVHSILRNTKGFELIGQPDEAETMQALLGKPTKDKDTFYSGDYSGATNNLNPMVSNVIADEISIVLGLDERERSLFLRSLTGHVFETEDGERDQKWGQLMGSITSFPILCIANFTVTRWAMEVHEKRTIAMRNTSIAINGDDVVFRSSAGAFPIYKRIAGFAGLSLSVGKTFVSKYFFTINSRAYNILQTPDKILIKRAKFQGILRTDVTREIVYRKCKFLNVGLIKGLKRAESNRNGIEDLVSKIASPAMRAKSIVEETPDHMLRKVYKKFLKTNEPEFAAAKLPYYVPTWLGGLGLPAPFEENKTTSLDRQIALTILKKWDKVEERPANLMAAKTPWLIRRVVSKKLPKPIETEDENAPGIRAFQEATLLQTIDLLFDSDVPLEMLYKEIAKVPVKAVLKHNRKLWNSRTYKRLSSEMLSDAVMFGPRGYESLAIVAESQLQEKRLEGVNPYLWIDDWIGGAEPVNIYPWEGPKKRSCKEIASGQNPGLGPWQN